MSSGLDVQFPKVCQAALDRFEMPAGLPSRRETEQCYAPNILGLEAGAIVDEGFLISLNGC
jgi:hypothetical protein